MKGIIRFLLVYVVCSFLVKCATVSSPLGGPKDTTAPRLLSASTENFSTNFNSSNIILNFDEYIKLNNASQNISTSPPLGKNVSFTAVKNKLFITFKEDLEPNITYHLNFGNSIVDVNEGNEFQNFQFIFSTGDKIDSLGIKGNLELVNNIELSKTTLIGLYRELNDSIFSKKAPFYYTYADENGSFLFRNIKNDTYQLVVLSDANGNKYYDLPTEAVGFLPNNITLDSNISNLNIPLFISEPEEYRMLSFTNNVNAYQIKYEFSKSIGLNDDLKIEFFDQDSVYNFKTSLDEERKTVTVFLDKGIDSLKNLEAVVKINETLIDTFQHSIANLKKPEQKISLKSTNFRASDSLIIETALPIVQIDKEIAIIDTVKQDTQQYILNQFTDNQLFIKTKADYDKSYVYTLLIEDSTILDNLGQYNRNYTIDIKFVDEEDLGMLKINFESVDSSLQYILRLIDENGELVKRRIVTSKDSFWEILNLEPGKYQVEIIEDLNQNGVWNSGSIKRKTYPEKISTYSNEIVVRPNWELEETINFAQP